MATIVALANGPTCCGEYHVHEDELNADVGIKRWADAWDDACNGCETNLNNKKKKGALRVIYLKNNGNDKFTLIQSGQLFYIVVYGTS